MIIFFSIWFLVGLTISYECIREHDESPFKVLQDIESFWGIRLTRVFIIVVSVVFAPIALYLVIAGTIEKSKDKK